MATEISRIFDIPYYQLEKYNIYNIYTVIYVTVIYMLLWSMGMISPFQGEEPSSSLGRSK